MTGGPCIPARAEPSLRGRPQHVLDSRDISLPSTNPPVSIVWSIRLKTKDKKKKALGPNFCSGEEHQKLGWGSRAEIFFLCAAKKKKLFVCSLNYEMRNCFS
ncbi:hypothetical protein AVEN_28592-1 [Araneus ventricosus]|uniref:Uncharacterized protein n=1 Tax=Araneus ventricosus TaxID=182803 RepID=A0A4Y2DG88_ARAVE|nr:hypothetical protein AVEN_28592-1 [Araneus ventricosus]